MQHSPPSFCLPLPEGFGNSPSQEASTIQPPSASISNVLSNALSNALEMPLRVLPATVSGWQTLKEDFRIIFDRDPAAHHWLEVLCCYPGFHAIALYRLAHWLHRHHVAFIPRLISHLTRFLTGIEIHPGAVIGKGVFIDHGMGVVIGETAIVGDYCLIYQGVTLGGTGKETGKRHPTLDQHVVVGAGAKILGNIHIGGYARIGAGSIVLRTVPSHCTAVGVPSRNIGRTNTPTCPLEHGQVPDAAAIALKTLLDRIETLENQVQQLTQHPAL